MAKVNSSTVLSKALQGFVKRLESTEKFVLEQAPAVAKEMILEAQLEAYLGILLGGAAFLVMATFSVYLFRFPPSETPEAFGFVAFISAVCLVPISCCSYDLLFLKKCPKLFLLRKFRELL